MPFTLNGRYFFYEPFLTENDNLFSLSENTARHCVQVLRIKQGETIELTNGKGLLLKVFMQKIDKKEALVKVLDKLFYPPSSNKISIAISLLKNTDRFEWFLEKVTELGINEITPLICHRTIRQNFRMERMQNKIVSAMLQSRQCWLPQLNPSTPFTQYISTTVKTTKIIAHCEKGNKKTLDEINYSPQTEIIIGPEGDFSLEEINLALNNNYIPVSLGHTRLRTETAGIAAAAVLSNKIKG